jgi:hypothetical protein
MSSAPWRPPSREPEPPRPPRPPRDAREPEPRPIHTYAWSLREAMLGAASRAPFFQGFTLKRTRELPNEVEVFPILAAYLMDGALGPESTGNHGELVFATTPRIGFSIGIINNDPDAMDTILDEGLMALMNALWTNPYVTNMIDTYDPIRGEGNPDNARFESIPRHLWRHQPATVGAKSETPVGQLVYEVSLFWRWAFGPRIEDDLLEIDFRTAMGWPHHDQVQQVHMPIKFMRPKKETENG